MTVRRSLPALALCFTTCAFAQPPMLVNAGLDTLLCAGQGMVLGGTPSVIGGTGPYFFQWSPVAGLNDPNLEHPTCTPLTTTAYTLTVADAGGGTAMDVVVISVLPSPTVQLTAEAPAVSVIYENLPSFILCDPAPSATFSFTDQSTAPSGSTGTVDWGDGSPLYEPSAVGWTATHTYTPGLYLVTYTVHGGACSTTAQYQVFLGTPPAVGLSVSGSNNICAGDNATFSLQNVAGDPPGTGYQLVFGDGTDISFTYPAPSQIEHTYLNASCPGGPFTATLLAYNPCSYTSSSISPITVAEAVQAAFTVNTNDTVCPNVPVVFTDTSTGAYGPNCAPPPHYWTISPPIGWATNSILGSNNGSNVPADWSTGSGILGVLFSLEGSYEITDHVGNAACGIDSESYTLTVDCSVGIPSHAPPVFDIGPVPSSGSFRVTFRTPPEPNTALTITDVRGSIVHRTPLSDRSTELELALPDGLYTATVHAPNGTTSHRMIMMR